MAASSEAAAVSERRRMFPPGRCGSRDEDSKRVRRRQSPGAAYHRISRPARSPRCPGSRRRRWGAAPGRGEGAGRRCRRRRRRNRGRPRRSVRSRRRRAAPVGQGRCRSHRAGRRGPGWTSGSWVTPVTPGRPAQLEVAPDVLAKDGRTELEGADVALVAGGAGRRRADRSRAVDSRRPCRWRGCRRGGPWSSWGRRCRRGSRAFGSLFVMSVASRKPQLLVLSRLWPLWIWSSR